jgi:hypothetical protein
VEGNPYQSPTDAAAQTGWRTGVGIIGTDGLSDDELYEEVLEGGRFIAYNYCFSVLVLTYSSSTSKVYFVRAGESRLVRGLNWSLASLLLGPWGFPWGPIYTFLVIGQNLSGGNDVTIHVAENLLRWSEPRLRAIDELG